MVNINLLTKEERTTVLRFAVSIGTRMVFSTNRLMRQLSESILENAFQEYENKHKKYDAFNIRQIYSISVDLQLSEKLLNIHNSLSPRVTFGYSNSLHEECDFVLTEKNKKTLLREATFYDYGSLSINEDSGGMIYYSDSEIFVGDKRILESVTHEFYFAIDFDDEIEKIFADFENKEQRNKIILKKLHASVCHENLIGMTAAIVVEKNAVTVETTVGRKFSFVATADNYNIDYNTELLGGSYKFEDGHVKIIDQNPTDFKSGGTYFIEDMDYYTGMQGETKAKAEDTFCGLFLNLKTSDGKYCDIMFESDRIFVETK